MAVIVALGVLGGQVGLLVWLLLWLRSEIRLSRGSLAEEARLRSAVDERDHGIDDRDRLLAALKEDLEREQAARRAVERHRDDLLETLANNGDARALAAGIRRELQALSAMSAPAAGAGGGASGGVHGAPGGVAGAGVAGAGSTGRSG